MSMQEHPGVIAPPVLIYAGTLIAGLGLDSLYPVYDIPIFARVVVAVVAIGLGVSCAVSAFAAMRAAHTTANPYRASTAIATTGVFGISRNPLYLALTLFYVAISFALNALLALALLLIVLWVMNRGVIDREEKYLTQKFGEEYLRYKLRVRRWL